MQSVRFMPRSRHHLCEEPQGSRARSHFTQRRLRGGDVGVPVRSMLSLKVDGGGLNEQTSTYTSSAMSEQQDGGQDYSPFVP